MTHADAAALARAWQVAGPRLEAVRRDEIRRTDHVAIVAAFDGVLEYARTHLPPRPTSGLVVQQRILSRLRRPG